MTTIKERYEALTELEKVFISTTHGMLRDICVSPEKYVVNGVSPVQLVEDLEFSLQGIWKFNRDSNYHTWWYQIKGCTCPAMDNADPMYFGQGKLIAADCPWHGDIRIN